MPSPNATPTPITPPRVPLVDPRTGLIDRAWYLFFLSLNQIAATVVDDVVGPDAESLIASYDAALQALAQNVDTQPLPVDLSAELIKQIEGLYLAPPPLQIYPDVGIASSTGSSWGPSYSTTGTGTVLALSEVPVLTVNDSEFTLQDETDPTKQAKFQLSGITTGTTRTYTLPNLTGTLATTGTLTQTFSGQTTFSGQFTLSSAANTLSLGTSATTGTLTIGGTSGTGIITLGRSTLSQTTNIQAGATASGSTKTIEVGTNGVSGSTTNITIGSTFGTTTTVNGQTKIGGSFGRGAPVTKTADFTLADTENWLINNKSGSTCTVTLPAASSWVGREVTFKNMQAQTLVSASSNVVPIDSTVAGTAILLAVVGNWATMVSDGTNWVIMQQAANNCLLLE